MTYTGNPTRAGYVRALADAGIRVVFVTCGLDWFAPGPSKHPVFGKVTSGMDVLKKIESTPTGAGDRPATPIKMIKVTVHD